MNKLFLFVGAHLCVMMADDDKPFACPEDGCKMVSGSFRALSRLCRCHNTELSCLSDIILEVKISNNKLQSSPSHGCVNMSLSGG